jgi:pre-mRNA-splicing factor ISY1
MAKRNEGKAQTMLNRWISIEKQMISQSMGKRPKDINSINDVQVCNIWRNQVIKEIAKKVGDIQNASLGEQLIRDLNDEINNLFEEKAQWEAKIKKLGGADYKKFEPKTLDAEGYEVPQAGGYRYFGAAKNLPGVAELFVNKPKETSKKSYMDMYKGIDLDYYGLGDYGIDDEESEKKREEMEKEEKMMESMLYLEYLDKINNKGNLNIFTDNKNKINNNINNSNINKNKIDKENDDLMDEE